MNRHTVIALSVAAALTLPIGFPSKAMALTADEQQTLSQAAIVGGPTLQASITAVLRDNAQDRPLTVVLDELATMVLQIGYTNEMKAEFGVALVAAARDLAAAGELPGYTAMSASDAAAEAVLVKVQNDHALVEAIMAQAAADAAADAQGGVAAAVLASFMAASTSPLIDIANRSAVQGAVIAAEGIGVGDVGSSTVADGASFGGGGGPDLSGFNLVQAQPGFGGNYSERTSRGETISPN